MAKIINIPQMEWYQPRELKLPIPDGWQLDICNMKGYDLPAMTDEQIMNAVTNLIGLPPIRELARGKKEVAIIFDDIHRPTRVSRILPFVLEELEKAGITDNNIRFIAANGTHAPMNREDFIKKLGEDVIARFMVYNHNPFFNCTYLGMTSRGNKVEINTEVMRCDFKITISSLTPHGLVVFSGGSKVILPGISSFETVKYNHTLKVLPEQTTRHENNPIHLDMDEAANMVGVSVNIEGLVNSWGDTISLYAGEFKESHNAAVRQAMTHYLTKQAEDKDIVVCNSYIKPTEAPLALGAAFGSIKKENGDIVLICNSPGGQVVHYGASKWGKFVDIAIPTLQFPMPSYVKRIIIYSEFPDYSGFSSTFGNKIVILNKWDDVLRLLKEDHGEKATVAVYPSADIRVFERK
jgi:lactate racemase